jgi:hypothetical protein
LSAPPFWLSRTAASGVLRSSGDGRTICTWHKDEPQPMEPRPTATRAAGRLRYLRHGADAADELEQLGGLPRQRAPQGGLLGRVALGLDARARQRKPLVPPAETTRPDAALISPARSSNSDIPKQAAAAHSSSQRTPGKKASRKASNTHLFGQPM